MSAVVDFLEGRDVDAAGRSVAQVLHFGLGALERHHDYIQWLFPLSEPSGAVAGAPVLREHDITALRASPLAQGNLLAGAALMGDFYMQTDHWLRASDHNHLRITRIIKSLRLLVDDTAADRFRSLIGSRVDRAAAPVSETSRRHWREA